MPKLFLSLTAFYVFSSIFSLCAYSATVPLTLLHTNDLHSHYRPSPGAIGLGGVARLATAINRAKASNASSLLLDGGDWSEGSIYYSLGAGRTSIELMNALHYDAAVVGNHDWLNGPDELLKMLKGAKPEFAILAANFDSSQYKQTSELKKSILPYKIFQLGSLKVGVIGLVTYEFIYDKYVTPIKITDPFSETRKLSEKLKRDNDVQLVIVISHNGLATNKFIAKMPDVDVVIHAHDHKKFSQPIAVDRGGKKSYIVEAYKWGYYLGKLDLQVDLEKKTAYLEKYELIQIDETLPEEPGIKNLVDHYERQLTTRYGDIFQDHLAESAIDVRREGPESLIGNLLTDAYREATGAEVSFEQVALTSEELYRGPLHTVNIYNALTSVWNPSTDKTWTLKTMKIMGNTLSWVLDSVLALSSISALGGQVSVSGIHAVVDQPPQKQTNELQINVSNFHSDLRTLLNSKLVRRVDINGVPLDPKRLYTVALPQGMFEALEFMRDELGNDGVQFTEFKDTGIEQWRVLAQYLTVRGTLQSNHISRGGRITVLQPDLGLYHDEISLNQVSSSRIEGTCVVRNLGEAGSAPRKLSIKYDATPKYFGDDPNPALDDLVTLDVPEIKPGQKKTLHFVLNAQSLPAPRTPLYFQLSEAPNNEDPVLGNDGTWVLFDRI